MDNNTKRRKRPTIQTLMRWDNEGVCYATDGCRCDQDGYCEHGKPSWFLVLGVI